MSRYQSHVLFSHRSGLDFRKALDEPDIERDMLAADMARMAQQLQAATAAGMHLVYAAVRAEAPVAKIGFTRRLTGRGGRLVRMPGCRLVTVMPGTRRDEMAVHQRLEAARVTVDLPGGGGSEHFELTDDVVDWVNETRALIGLDPIERRHLLAS